MGYMCHHAIVVTSFDEEKLQQAHDNATGLGMSVTPIVYGAVDFYSTFCVVPDGSKEGWDESTRGDEQRAAFTEWLDGQRYSDGSTALDWVEVQFGDDDGDTCIVRDSDEHYRRGTVKAGELKLNFSGVSGSGQSGDTQ